MIIAWLLWLHRRYTAETTFETGLRHPTNKRVRRCISTNMYESNPFFSSMKKGANHT